MVFTPPKNAVQRAILLGSICHQTYSISTSQESGTDRSRSIIPLGYATVDDIVHPETGECFGSVLQSCEGDDNTVIVAFRGMTANRNLPNELTQRIVRGEALSQVPFHAAHTKGMKTHSGFTELYESLRTPFGQTVVDVLNGLPKINSLYLTGHSLGGALATLCAVDIALRGQYYPHVYTFASPRVGNPVFAHVFSGLVPESIRIYNRNDYFPLEPQSTIPFQQPILYRHVKGGYEIRFQAGDILENHSIQRYFYAVAAQDRSYYLALCAENPFVCPVPPSPVLRRDAFMHYRDCQTNPFPVILLKALRIQRRYTTRRTLV